MAKMRLARTKGGTSLQAIAIPEAPAIATRAKQTDNNERDLPFSAAITRSIGAPKTAIAETSIASLRIANRPCRLTVELSGARADV
jgi:hypothetical protein